MRPFQWIARLLGKPLGEAGKSRDRFQRDLVPELCVTRLETRRVLNGDGVVSELVIDAGAAADDGQSDTFQIETKNEQLQVSINGEVVSRTSLGQISEIKISAEGCFAEQSL